MDDPDLLEIVKVFLEEEGLFQVDTAISASFALPMPEGGKNLKNFLLFPYILIFPGLFFHVLGTGGGIL